MSEKEAWDAGTSWLMPAHKAWVRLGDLNGFLVKNPRLAQRHVSQLRSDLEEAGEKASGKAQQVVRKVLGTLKELIADLNRVRWSMVGERFREDTKVTVDGMRRQLAQALPVTAASKDTEKTVEYRITVSHSLRPKFERFLALCEYNGRVGHGAACGLYMDGDGPDKLIVESPDLQKYQDEVRKSNLGDYGHAMEKAGDSGYSVVHFKKE